MRYLLFVSLLCCIGACAPKPYQHLVVAPEELVFPPITPFAKDYQVHFDKVLYNCRVYGKNPLGKKYSLSGLLFFKNMEDGSTRLVFQNQMGITYFDFGWDSDNKFTVHQVMEQMNKPLLIKTLKKDFELLLFKNLHEEKGSLFMNKNGDVDYVRFALSKGFVYYIFNKGKIIGIENADEKRKIVVFDIKEAQGINPLASSISIKHLRANFTIDLEQISQEAKNDNNDIRTE